MISVASYWSAGRSAAFRRPPPPVAWLTVTNLASCNNFLQPENRWCIQRSPPCGQQSCCPFAKAPLFASHRHANWDNKKGITAMMEGTEIFDPEVLDEMLGELDSQLSRERNDPVCAGAVTQGPPHGAPHDAWQATAVLARDVSKAAITPEQAPRLAMLRTAAQSKAREAAQRAEALRRATVGMQRIRHAVASQVALVLHAQSIKASQYVQPQHLTHYPSPGASSPFAGGGQKPPLSEEAPASPFSSPNLRFLANFLDAPGLQPTGAFSGLPSSPYQGPLYPQTGPVVAASPLPCLQPKPSAGRPSAGSPECFLECFLDTATGRCIEKALERQPSLSSAVSSAPSSPTGISSSAAATDAACPTNPAPAAIPLPALPVSTSVPTSIFAAITTTTHSATMASPAAVGEVAQPAGADAQCSLHQQRLEAQRKAKVQARVALAIAQARQKAGNSLKRSRGEEGGSLLLQARVSSTQCWTTRRLYERQT